MLKRQARGRLGVCGNDIVPLGFFKAFEEDQKLQNMVIIQDQFIMYTHK